MADKSLVRGLTVTVLTFLVVLGLFLFGLSQIDTRSAAEQMVTLKTAVLRAVMTCYAVEGRYPSDIGYLTDYYGLVYNSRRFIVTLDSFADNLLPDITVLTREEA